MSMNFGKSHTLKPTLAANPERFTERYTAVTTESGRVIIMDAVF